MQSPLGRISLLGVLALSMLAMPAIANGADSKKHFAKMYKVEKHVDIEGEFPNDVIHTHVYCNPGDYAVDGSWRVDHVDQENPQIGIFGTLKDVNVFVSYNDGAKDGDLAEWHFEARNNADGRAQVKFFVVCLSDRTTQTNGHDHSVDLDPSPAGYSDERVLVATGPGQVGMNGGRCNTGEYIVAPGFKIKRGTARLLSSFPTNTATPHFGWTWDFVVSALDPIALDFRADVYYQCLKMKTGSATAPGDLLAHAHALAAFWKQQSELSGPGIKEHQISCGDHHKAIVGGHNLFLNHHWWYHGNDPRPKKRAFKLENTDAASHPADLYALCLRERTGKQIAP